MIIRYRNTIAICPRVEFPSLPANRFLRTESCRHRSRKSHRRSRRLTRCRRLRPRHTKCRKSRLPDHRQTMRSSRNSHPSPRIPRPGRTEEIMKGRVTKKTRNGNERLCLNLAGARTVPVRSGSDGKNTSEFSSRSYCHPLRTGTVRAPFRQIKTLPRCRHCPNSL